MAFFHTSLATSVFFLFLSNSNHIQCTSAKGERTRGRKKTGNNKSERKKETWKENVSNVSCVFVVVVAVLFKPFAGMQFTQVACAESFVLALQSNGRVWSFGHGKQVS